MTPQPAEALQIKLNDETRWIFGQPCFAVIDIAQILRLGGHQIKHRAEDEQATVIHWMLNLYLKHGDDWRAEGTAILNKIKTEHVSDD